MTAQVARWFGSVALVWLGFGGMAAAATTSVGPGGDLQLALVNARPGDVIELAAGATFVGNFTLPRKDGSGNFIVIRSAGITGIEGRVNPDSARGFAKIQSPNSSPAVQTAPGAHHWRIELVEISGAGLGDLVALGEGASPQTTASSVPHDLVIDRTYIHGDSGRGVKRCVAANSASTTISNSYISDCKAAGQDAQAIAGWNGPGPFSIVNNYLEGSGENLLFGGADPAIPDLVPSDIEIHDNLIAKPTAWRQQAWQSKNLLELKNARRVTISGNTLEYSWQAAQQGYAVLFTVRNQDGRCRWCQVEDVTFARNTVRHAGAGFQILGYDDEHPSQQTQRITIRDNVISDINPKLWGGSGYAFLILGAPRDLLIDHNTIIQTNAPGIVQVDGPPVLGFTFTNNITQHGTYGFIGTDRAPGNDTIRTFFPAPLIARNVIADGDAARYPAGNWFPSSNEFRAQFQAFDGGNFRLVVNSSWRNAATDGTDLGASAAGRERDGTPPRGRGGAAAIRRSGG
jgi:hypothetical protein